MITSPGLCSSLYPGFANCPSIQNTTYYANYTLGTPMGIIPLAMGEGHTALPVPLNSAIMIASPPAVSSLCNSAGCPAPNAVGWYAGLSTTSGLEFPQIPDGVNAFCGTNGAPSNYVGNLPHGALCALGQPEIIVAPQKQ